MGPLAPRNCRKPRRLRRVQRLSCPLNAPPCRSRTRNRSGKPPGARSGRSNGCDPVGARLRAIALAVLVGVRFGPSHARSHSSSCIGACDFLGAEPASLSWLTLVSGIALLVRVGKDVDVKPFRMNCSPRDPRLRARKASGGVLDQSSARHEHRSPDAALAARSAAGSRTLVTEALAEGSGCRPRSLACSRQSEQQKQAAVSQGATTAQQIASSAARRARGGRALHLELQAPCAKS